MRDWHTIAIAASAILCGMFRVGGCMAQAQGYAPWLPTMMAKTAQLREQPTTTGLIAYFGMDSVSGTAVSDQYGVNDATAYNSPPFGTSYGVREDGVALVATSTQRITTDATINGLDGVSTFTVSAWVRQATGANGCIIATASAETAAQYAGWQLRVRSDGKIRIAHYSPSPSYSYTYDTVATPLSSGAWHHVVVVFRLGALSTTSIYVDGSVVTGGYTLIAGSGTEGSSITHEGPLDIGATRFSGGLADYLTGYVDEVRIYATELSHDDIVALYDYDKAGAGH